MKRFTLAILALATLAVLAATPASGQEEEPSSPLAIELTDPADPDPGEFNFYDVDAEIEINGTASVGNTETGPDTSLVLVFDRSGSTGATFNCGAANTIIACEREALKRVVAELPPGRVTTVTVISFASNATNHGTFPADDTAAIDGAIGTGNGGASGGTNYEAALSEAFGAITDAADQNIVVFVSDGENTAEIEALPEPPPNTNVKSFAIGGAGCNAEGFPSLTDVATGGDCTEVGELGSLDVTILEAITTELTGIAVTAGAVGATVVTAPALPTSLDVAFTATFAPNSLPLGTQSVCATASGEAGGEAVTPATDCVDITVVDATIDCALAVLCEVQASDPGIADAVVTGNDQFEKKLGVTAGLPAGDEDFITGFNVQFAPGNNPDAIVELVVTMSRANSTPPGRAQVFIDDELVATKCNRRWDPTEDFACATIKRVSGGRTQYLVRFAGDPFAKFR